MAYIPTNENYKDIIYSGDARHKLKILFNQVELEDADIYCEKLTLKRRILPDDASKRLGLDNFVSSEIELILHDIDESIIQDQVEISIGTLVDTDSLGDIYEYVPLGIFNIQDTPITDKNKITIKLRDNAVLFDFAYNAKPLMDDNDGKATKMQILQDICSQAGVNCDVLEFEGDEDEIAIYDSTIMGRTYVSYIAEQSGAIATIDRDGDLIFIYLNDLVTQKIPLYIVEKYEIGTSFNISRVVYEDAIRKYESSSETEQNINETLYLNSANPYVSNQEQIDYINTLLNGFEIDSISTGKILGDPAIDGYDLIQIYGYYDNDNQFVDDETTIVATTLANHTLTYNGKCISVYDTQIGLEERKENVTLKGEATFRKFAKTEIDNINAEVRIQAQNIEEVQNDLTNNYYEKGSVDTLILNSATGITNTFSEAGGNNIFRNTGLWFSATSTEFTLFPSLNTFPSNETFMGNKVLYEYWNGDINKVREEKSANSIALLLKAGEVNQEQQVPNGNYTISFKYKKLITLANVSVKINDIEYELSQENDTEFVQTIEVSSQHINVLFKTDIEDSCEIYDLMVNAGTVKLAYSQNQNETTTETVNISKGITIKSTNTDTTFKANADGIRTLDKNENVLTEFTDEGMTTKKMVVEEQSQIVGLLVQQVGSQTWITRL